MHRDSDTDRVTNGCSAKFERDAAFHVVENSWSPVYRGNIRKTFPDLVKRAGDANAAGGFKPGDGRTDQIDSHARGRLRVYGSIVYRVNEERV